MHQGFVLDDFADQFPDSLVGQFSHFLCCRFGLGKFPAGFRTVFLSALEYFATDGTTAFAVPFQYLQHAGVNLLPPFRTIDFIILKGYIVREFPCFDFYGDGVVLYHDLDNGVIIGTSIIIEPNDVGGVMELVVVS